MAISDIAANNRQSFYSEPAHMGGTVSEIELLEGNFEPEVIQKRRNKPKPTSYLLIGFDTEYQSRPPVTKKEKESGARNELL